jgi:hypothetical protein
VSMWRNEFIARAPRLGFIQSISAGTDQYARDALKAAAPHRGLVTLRQTFVCCCQHCTASATALGGVAGNRIKSVVFRRGCSRPAGQCKPARPSRLA